MNLFGGPVEHFIDILKGLDQKTLVMGISVVLLWIFLKALRGLIHVLLFLSVIAVVVVEFPAVKHFFISLIS